MYVCALNNEKCYKFTYRFAMFTYTFYMKHQSVKNMNSLILKIEEIFNKNMFYENYIISDFFLWNFFK